MSDFGHRIRSRRKELKLSLRELARRASLSVSFLSEVETGKRGIGADSLLAVAQVLGIPLDQIMKGGEQQTAGVDIQLPASLMRLGSEENLPFRRVMCLFWMVRTIQDHRTNDRKVNLETWDWKRFYEAVKEFL